MTYDADLVAEIVKRVVAECGDDAAGDTVSVKDTSSPP